jgi:2-polyprenyl-3-methyl-5-hydroxy-6-metoxy-1,4-benzoquinol methylase
MLSFEDYKRLAQSDHLTDYQKVGFESAHREEQEVNIFPDIASKVSNLSKPSVTVMDIGCGCSKPVRSLVKHTKESNQRLILVDSAEMLANLPDEEHVVKCSHEFPRNEEFLRTYESRVDVVIIYSVLQAIADFQNPFTFLDRAIDLLAPGGEILIGDITNISKKKRFLSSRGGAEFHERWSGESCPKIDWNCKHSGFDDSTVLQILLRYRLMGLESYLLPQGGHMPLGNTREDVLVRKYV